MCGRYFIDSTPEIQKIITEMNRSALAGRYMHTFGRSLVQSGEVRPNDIVPVIAPDRHGLRAVFPMVWGYSLSPQPGTSSGTILFNARIETAKEKRTFKDDWKKHRCAVPASYYFEWEHISGKNGREHTGSKYMIQPAERMMLWFAGLYRIEDGFPHFAILTREPGESIRFIHDRMPVILPSSIIKDWISPDSDPDSFEDYMLTDMYCEKA